MAILVILIALVGTFYFFACFFVSIFSKQKANKMLLEKFSEADTMKNAAVGIFLSIGALAVTIASLPASTTNNKVEAPIAAQAQTEDSQKLAEEEAQRQSAEAEQKRLEEERIQEQQRLQEEARIQAEQKAQEEARLKEEQQRLEQQKQEEAAAKAAAQRIAPIAAPVFVQRETLGGGYSCNCAKTCAQMSSCAEAQYQLNSCGCSQRDADDDGIACDSDCQ